MTRPLRIEFPGAVYHVTSRGDRREPIFDDDVDRQAFIDVVALALKRFDACALAFCLMKTQGQALPFANPLSICANEKVGTRYPPAHFLFPKKTDQKHRKTQGPEKHRVKTQGQALPFARLLNSIPP